MLADMLLSVYYCEISFPLSRHQTAQHEAEHPQDLHRGPQGLAPGEPPPYGTLSGVIGGFILGLGPLKLEKDTILLRALPTVSSSCASSSS